MLRNVVRQLSRKRQEGLLVASVILGSVLVLFHDVLFLGRSFHGRDVTPFFYPMKHFLAETVRGGAIPLWNPWVANGEPFFASLQPAIFYPPSMLLYLLPLPFAFDLLTVLHYPLAGVGFYVLLRRWRHEVAGALVGALAFMLGGYFASLGNFLNNLQTVAWIPWLFLVWDRYLETGAREVLVLFSILAAVAFLGGEPQMLAIGLLVLAAHGLSRVETRELARKKQLIGLGLAGALTLGIVAFQLLPFLEYMGESVRTMQLRIEYSARMALEPTALWQLLIPPVIGAGPFGFTTQFLFSSEVPWLLSVYPGAVVVLLAAMGFVLPKRRRWLAFWTVCGALGVLLAMGKHSPLYTLLFDLLPPIRTLRYPEKFYFLTALALPVLAARGADVCLRPAGRGRRRIVLALIGVVGAYLFLAGLLFLVPDLFHRICGETSKMILCARSGEAQTLYAGALLWPVVATALIALLILVSRKLARPALLAGALVLLCSVDLLLPHRAVNPSVTRDFYSQVPWAVQAVRDDGLDVDWYRFRSIPLSSTMGEIFAVRGAYELSNLYLTHEAGGANRGQVHGLLHQDGMQGIELRSVAETIDAGMAAEDEQAVRFLRLMGVKYNVDGTSYTASLPGIERVGSHPDFPLGLFRIPDPLPRAYLATQFLVETDRRRALWAAIDPAFPLGSKVVLEREPSPRPDASATGKILETEFGREVVRLQVRTEGPAILALTDRAHPGWKVRVNGRRAELHTANGYFRAVALPEGEHQVVFRYRPRSVRIGGGISAVTLFGLTLFGLRRRRNGR